MPATSHLSQRTLSRDTQATLLLIARLGDKPQAPPLSRREYNALAAALLQQQLRPGDLLDPGVVDRLVIDPRVATHDRLRFLLGRVSGLAFTLEAWMNAGVWVIGRGDPEYPQRIRRILRGESPPVFYGAGAVELLQHDGVGIVGSRDMDAPSAQFARLLARLCVSQNLTVVSGAARGVDSEAMLAAVDQGGKAVGILAGDLQRQTLSKAWRGHIRDRSVTLLSPFEPSAHFTVGYAMERNRYVYAMSRFVTVVSAAAGEGGTWAGAIENLDQRWVPLVVRADEGAPAGNAALVNRGATALRFADLENQVNLRDLYRVAADDQRSRTNVSESLELPFVNGASYELAEVEPQIDSVSTNTIGSPGSVDIDDASTAATPVAESTHRSEPDGRVVDLFALVWPSLRLATVEPRTLDELKIQFTGVLESQLKAWLSRAVEEGLLRRSGRPQRYSS